MTFANFVLKLNDPRLDISVLSERKEFACGCFMHTGSHMKIKRYIHRELISTLKTTVVSEN